jgi:hypothetical protein
LLVSEFVEHCHPERSHQGLANALMVQRATTANDNVGCIGANSSAEC